LCGNFFFDFLSNFDPFSTCFDKVKMEIEDEWFRPAACYLVQIKKLKQKDVAELFGVNPKRVSRAIKRFDETGSHKDRAGKGRKRTARSEEVIQEAANLLQQNSHTKLRNGVSGNSSRKLAAKLGISRTSTRRILRKDLGLKPWKKKERQKLTAAQKQKRLERATALRTRFEDGMHRQILFSDEKFFSIEEAFNPQNDRIWSAEQPSEDERAVERQMKPKGVMVWAGFGYDAKAPLIFVESGVKINTDVYRQEILEPVEEWAQDHYGVDEEGYWNEWTFQQDGAPSHTSTNPNPDRFEVPTQTWLNDHFPNFINKNEWPPSSPDLNPLDYSIWSIIESETNAQAHTSVESLRRAIIRVFDNLDQETINRAIDDWPRRLDAVIESQGGHFE